MKQTGLTWEVWVSCAPGDARALKRLRAAMAVCGIPDAAIVEYSADNEVRLSWYNTSSRQAHAMRSALRASLPLEVGAHIHALKNSDWQSRWKESLHPFMLTRNIRVVPAWNKGRRTRFSGETIYIDTVLAFGTGLHPTTRLTAGFIENKRNEIKEFLDIGTGTGILSIVARKYGVSWVGGLDNDQGSITTACKNAMANGCSFDYLKVADINTLTLCREFDFVAANLLAPILIGARDRIVSLVRPGKYLAVSGVTTSDYPRFRKAFATPQLRCVRLLRSHGWIAALYQRKNTK